MYSNLKLLLNYCSSNTKLLSNCCTVWWHFIDIYCKWLLDLPLHNYLVHSYLPLILSTLEPKICKDDNIQLCYEMVASSYKESRNNVTCIYIVWYGMVQGLVWYGTEFGMVWYSVWYGMVHSLVCMVHSLVWYGTEFGMVWYRVWYVWYRVWYMYGMVQILVWYGREVWWMGQIGSKMFSVCVIGNTSWAN